MKKKTLMLLAVVVLAVGNAVAQTDSKKGSNEWRLNLSYDFGLKSESKGMIGIKPEFGHYIADNVYLGIGTGVIGMNNFKSVSIPIFAHAEYDFSTSSDVVPYFSVQGGYDIYTSGGGGGAGEVNPSIGVKFPIGKNTDMNIGVGYTRLIAKGGYGADYAGVKAGFIFDTAGRGLAKFLRKADYSVGVEYYIPNKVTDGEYEEKYKMYGIQLNALFPVYENLTIGPSIGFGLVKHIGNYSNYTKEYLSAMLRFRYDVNQVTFLGSMHPYAYLDAGLRPTEFDYFGYHFGVNPNVGVSYDLNNGGAIDLSVGYAKINYDDDISKGILKIALGYKF